MADSAVPVRYAYKSSIIPEINPVPTCFFAQNPFYGNVLRQSKSIRFWATSVSILKYVQI